MRWVHIFTLLIVCATNQAAAAVKVVATLPTLAAVAAEVGGAEVEVQALASPAEDPHFVDARPNLILALNHADLLVANGLELEIGWLPPLQVSARNAKIGVGGAGYLEAAQYVTPLEIPKTRIDRSMGDLHPGGNPHFLNDPTRMAAIAQGIASRLGDIDPEHLDVYKKNAADFSTRSRDFAAAQASRFKSLAAEQRQVVTYHKSLAYLLTWLGLEEVATLEPRPGVPPDPAHVASVLNLMRLRHVPAIVQEEYYPAGTSKTLAELAKARVVTIHGGVRFDKGERYFDFLRDMTDTLHAALAK